MPSFQAPRGMRDLLPEEAAAYNALQAVIEARALRYGYPRIVRQSAGPRCVRSRRRDATSSGTRCTTSRAGNVAVDLLP